MLAAVFGTSSDASASSAEVSGTGKGIAGGALLGGEIGFLGLSAFGVKKPVYYWTVPTVLAIGGGVGGYFIEQNADPHVPMYMLAGGMALVIPTVVITLSANAYSPTSEDGTPIDATTTSTSGPGSATGTINVNTGGSGGSSTTPPAPAKRKPEASLRTRQVPLALVNVGENASSLSLGMPLVSLRPMYTRTEVAMYGQQQKYEVHAPVVALSF